MYDYYNYYGGGAVFNSFSDQSEAYWIRSFFQRARALIEVDGLPDAGVDQIQTDRDALLWGLFHCGFLAVFKTRDYGMTFQPATPAGMGLQYEPVGMMVASPYFNFDRALTIGSECEVLKLTPDYAGIWDIITKYAREMMLAEIAIRQSMINARFTYAIAARNDKEARSIKGMMERVENADPYMVYNSALTDNRKGIGQTSEPMLPWAQFDRDLKKNFILPELLEARRTIITDFYKEMGVSIQSDKKERENVLETSISQNEFYNRREVWNDCLKESCKRINDLYGTSIEIKMKEVNMNDLPSTLDEQPE